MATRLHYALPFAAQLIASTTRRLRGKRPTAVPTEGRPFIIVTGLGRSGTSAVARVLHESGVLLGEHFRDPTEENITGFYEELPVCDLNDEIMAESGIAGLRRYPWRSTVLAVAKRFQKEMAALANTDAAGWKDPRFSVMLEPWLPYLPGPPKLIVCLRSSEAFLHSVAQIFGLIDRDLAERWWARELRRLLDVIRDYEIEAMCVEYDDLIQQPEETVAKISAFVGHSLDASYVEPKLRHFAYHIPHRLAPIYNEVRALGPAESPPPPVAEGAPATPEAIDAYTRQVSAIDTKVEAAKKEWARRTGAPALHLAHYQDLGLDPTDVYAEGRAASEAYIAIVGDAQAELGPIAPPAGFEAYHEATQAAVNDARLVAQLMLQAAEHRRAVDDVLKAYELRLSPKAIAKTQQRRALAFERGRKSAARAQAGR